MNRLATLIAVLVALIGPTVAGPPGGLGRPGLIDRFLRQPVGTVPVSRYTGRVREFTLDVRRITAEIAPGVRVEQWAFAIPGQPVRVPGPEIRVRQGIWCG
ncbi:hypothetical protein ACFSC4_05155 [Deinococcus malanensis]|uniref:hypothetical protein n=1 Tax=Deinococcus malanensis TaxID=1706855 RepID=UPI00363E6B5A